MPYFQSCSRNVYSPRGMGRNAAFPFVVLPRAVIVIVTAQATPPTPSDTKEGLLLGLLWACFTPTHLFSKQQENVFLKYIRRSLLCLTSFFGVPHMFQIKPEPLTVISWDQKWSAFPSLPAALSPGPVCPLAARTWATFVQ